MNEIESPRQRSKNLRDLFNQADELIDSIGNEEVFVKSKEILEDVNELRNLQADEHTISADKDLLDAKLLDAVTNLCLETLDTIDPFKSSYSNQEFAEKLLEYVKEDDDFNWSKLEEKALSLFTFTPNHSYLYGALQITESDFTTQQRQRKPREKVSSQVFEKKTPEELEKVEQAEQNVEIILKEMYQIVRELYKNEKQPIPYYNFLFDPEDFSKTIENVFHFSFLVHDKLVKIVNVRDVPHIELVTRKRSVTEMEHGEETTSDVFSIDFETWRKLCRDLCIESCIFNKKRRELSKYK